MGNDATKRRIKEQLTFDFAELIDALETGGIVQIVRLKRHSEKVAIGYDLAANLFRLIAAQSRHLAVG